MTPSNRQGQLLWIGLAGGLALMLSACDQPADQPADQSQMEPTQQESTTALGESETDPTTTQQ